MLSGAPRLTPALPVGAPLDPGIRGKTPETEDGSPPPELVQSFPGEGAGGGAWVLRICPDPSPRSELAPRRCALVRWRHLPAAPGNSASNPGLGRE